LRRYIELTSFRNDVYRSLGGFARLNGGETGNPNPLNPRPYILKPQCTARWGASRASTVGILLLVGGFVSGDAGIRAILTECNPSPYRPNFRIANPDLSPGKLNPASASSRNARPW